MPLFDSKMNRTHTIDLLSRPLVSPGGHRPAMTLLKLLHSPCTRSFTSWNMFILSPSLLITSPARAS